MSINEIMNEISKGGYEYAVFKLLSNYIIDKQRDLDNQNNHYKASIKAIKKINRGKNKDIDSLCEMNE